MKDHIVRDVLFFRRTGSLSPVTAQEWREKAAKPFIDGDSATVLLMYENVFRLSEPTADDYSVRSRALFDQQRFEESLSDCKKAVELGMDAFPARLRRARCRTYLSQWEAALEELKALVAEFPDSKDVLTERAEVHGYMKQWSACRADYRMLTLQFNDSLAARYGYAIACASEGLTEEFELACREFRIANQIKSNQRLCRF